MSELLPLISHRAAADPVAYRNGVPVSAARFLADVAQVRARLPAGAHLLNVCTDRYLFAVGLGAALTAGRISLLPQAYTPAAIADLRAFAPDAFCLTDDAGCAVDLPRLRVDEAVSGAREGDATFAVPRIAASQVAAFMFTSGSTGAPLAHRKSWGKLVRCVRAGAARLGLDAGAQAAPHAVVATVPPQHMFGFESSVLLPLQAGHALCAERPFHPAEVVAALARVPRPRVLVTTPVHLRVLIASGLQLPTADLLLSATAPLAQQLARDSEQRFGAPLVEIYGSTETGQIASRRTAVESQWQSWPDVTLVQGLHAYVACGGHVEEPTELQDVIEPCGPGRFLLHGRRGDLVNIAGKRSSLGYLNHHLTSIPGVRDGVFVLREEGAESTCVTRLAALVVAPGVSPAQLLEALRERIDPAFLPRPLLLVDALPRNATGKLPRAVIDELLSGRPAKSGWNS